MDENDIEWPPIKAVARVSDFGDWYFLTAARAYLTVISVLEKNTSNVLQFMLSGLRGKGSDWKMI